MKKIKFLIVICFFAFAVSNCNKSNCGPDDQDTFPYKCETGMDVAFLIDYTASMGGVIDSIKANVSNIVNTIVTKSTGDYRLSLSIFDETNKLGAPAYALKPDYISLPPAQRIINTSGILTNQHLTMLEPFNTANQIGFNSQLSKLNTGAFPLGSGVNGAEPGSMLADKIVNANFAGAFRNFKNKIVIIITDAPDGGDDDDCNATDDTFLATLASQANLKQVQFILVTSQSSTPVLPGIAPYFGFAANYSVKLINNNVGGLQSTNANLRNIAPIINQMINNLCTNNAIK